MDAYFMKINNKIHLLREAANILIQVKLHVVLSIILAIFPIINNFYASNSLFIKRILIFTHTLIQATKP